MQSKNTRYFHDFGIKKAKMETSWSSSEVAGFCLKDTPASTPALIIKWTTIASFQFDFSALIVSCKP